MDVPFHFKRHTDQRGAFPLVELQTATLTSQRRNDPAESDLCGK